jgi:hypothetical protein
MNVDPAAVLHTSLEKHSDAFDSLLPSLFIEQDHIVKDRLEGQGASKKYHHNLNQNVQEGNEEGVRLNFLFICEKPDSRESLSQ